MIEQAKADFLQAQQGLIRALDKTPPERQKWSPSDTARSPLEVAAHAAFAVGSMLDNLTGDTFAIPTTAEADVYFREAEQTLDSRDKVVECLERNGQAYLEWLDTVTPEILAAQMKVPFGFGEVPMTAGISFMAAHLNWHAAQIHYIQTIYGDRDWF